MPTSILASVTLHVAAFLAILFASAHPPAVPAPDVGIDVQLDEPAPPPPPPPVEQPPPVATPTPPVAALPKPVTPVREQRVVQPPVPADLPPPPQPVTEPPPASPRRVVGIEMESTTTGGTGAAFAIGSGSGQGSPGSGGDSDARGAATSFTPPRRTSAPAPEYPAALKSRGIEGDVGLAVQIDASGRVTSVAVVSPSGHPEFDRSAADAAARSSYSPARVDGTPVAHSIEFTVRFRLHP